MQFLELDCDPWREQGFIELETSVSTRIPIDDRDAFNLYPEHRWVYDKSRVCESQGIECGTWDREPSRYPVFCKPLTNLQGTGLRGCVLTGERDLRVSCGEGYFWMRLLAGDQVSTDLAVVNGEVAWSRHTLAVPGGTDGVDYWVIEERSRPRLERYCRDWVGLHLRTYTGLLNIESIGGRIISVHLRAADQWPDLYGRKWLDALVSLYLGGTWDAVDNDRAEGYSVVLTGVHGVSYSHPDPHLMAALRATVGISSIQLTLSKGHGSDLQPAPASGLRLAVINGFNLAVALRVRAALAREFDRQISGSPERAVG